MLRECIVAVIILSTMVIHGYKLEDSKNFQQHLRRAIDFSCRVPRPQAVPVSQLTTVGPDQMFAPLVTVLHRCGESGCCLGSPLEACAVTSDGEEFLSLPFEVRYARQNEPATVIYVAAVNHTSCKCSLSALHQGPR